MTAGDHDLVTEFLVDGQIAATNRQRISIIDRRDERLAALKQTIASWPDDEVKTSADQLSSRASLERLQALAARRTPESDVPAATLLAALEAQVRDVEAGKPYLSRNRCGVLWVTLPLQMVSNVATRIFVPESAAKGEPIPLVVALHGAGGSENMFFETYGHGAIVDLCKMRGWMLVAPRSGFFGSAPVNEIVDALAKISPIDMRRVLLVGHSMGAAQAVAASRSSPSRFAAVAALGGGGAVRKVPGLDAIPFFVGVGKDDFARDGARRLAESLRRAGANTFHDREYDHIEHLGIVQIALDDVFRFLTASDAAHTVNQQCTWGFAW